jgi:hypothetical protein
MLKKVALRTIIWGVGALLAGTLFLMPSAPSAADEHWHHGYHDRDVHHWDRHDLGLWRAGRWRHVWHDGRWGWWWVVGGIWYFYPQPVYPYPLVMSEVVAPPTVVVPAPVAPGAPVVVQPAPAPQPQMWYYCDNPPGYYPNVPTCTVPFRAVPARPQ